MRGEEQLLLTLHTRVEPPPRHTATKLTEPVLAGERAVVGGATTALTWTWLLDTLPARELPAGEAMCRENSSPSADVSRRQPHDPQRSRRSGHTHTRPLAP
jgi:hypothetical protein